MLMSYLCLFIRFAVFILWNQCLQVFLWRQQLLQFVESCLVCCNTHWLDVILKDIFNVCFVCLFAEDNAYRRIFVRQFFFIIENTEVAIRQFGSPDYRISFSILATTTAKFDSSLVCKSIIRISELSIL